MKEFCVISHTHWDREWYQPFENFRLKLVDLIDELIEIISKNKEYIFHLDAQTIVIEDYLQIRPEKKDILYNLIQKGNILVGPWYMQNDFYLTSGEVTIRNLIEGKRLSEEAGGYKKYGYAPDQFGNISQLPQILNDFGIDTFIFGRGYNEYYNEAGECKKADKPCEFIWLGADGSRLYTIFMAYWYNNAQRFSADLNKAELLLDISEKQFKNISLIPYILMMNGVDHLEAQDDLLEILEKLRQHGRKIRQVTLPQYLSLVKSYINSKGIKLNEYKGELNKGNDYELLKGCWSSRIYLKRENVLVQNMIENQLEPLYSMLELAGLEGCYPSGHMRYLWKKYMKNHPHDNICGCSTDAVHSHMEDDFKRINEVSKELLFRGMNIASRHINPSVNDINGYKIVIANTSNYTLNNTVKAEIEILDSDNYKGINIVDRNNNKIDFCVTKTEKRKKDIFSPLNLPGIIDVTCYHAEIYLSNIKPYSFECLKVEPDKKNTKVKKSRNGKLSYAVIDNGLLKLSVSASQGVELTGLSGGKTLKNFISFEDSADRGGAYVFTGDPYSKPLIFDKPDYVQLTECNDLIYTVKAVYNITLPENYDFKNLKRGAKTVVNTLIVEFTLKKSNDVLEISYILKNKSKDHRLRLLVNSNCPSKDSYADIPFDVLKRTAESLYFNTEAKTHFNSSFAASGGLAVLTEGCHEYENLEDGRLAFTLVRSTGSINMGPDFKPVGGINWIVPDNQCQRVLKGRFGLVLYGGDFDIGSLCEKISSFRTEPLVLSSPCDYRKFNGGRTAVQDTRLGELYYKKDGYEGKNINCGNILVEVKGKGIAVSALKKCETGNGIILRLVNLTDELRQAEIISGTGFYKTTAEETAEEYLGKGKISVNLPPKKIMTLKLKN